MLGRYISGTILILGVAMLVTPNQREARPSEATVSRADTSPSALTAATQGETPSYAPAAEPEKVTSLTVPALAPQKEETLDRRPDLIEAAVLTADVAASNGEVTLAGIEALAGLTTTLTQSGEPFADAELLYVTGSRVNVRSGTSTSFGVISSVARGDAVELVAYEANGWAQIRLSSSGETGFMAARFLNETPGG